MNNTFWKTSTDKKVKYLLTYLKKIHLGTLDKKQASAIEDVIHQIENSDKLLAIEIFECDADKKIKDSFKTAWRQMIKRKKDKLMPKSSVKALNQYSDSEILSEMTERGYAAKKIDDASRGEKAKAWILDETKTIAVNFKDAIMHRSVVNSQHINEILIAFKSYVKSATPSTRSNTKYIEYIFEDNSKVTYFIE